MILVIVIILLIIVFAVLGSASNHSQKKKDILNESHNDFIERISRPKNSIGKPVLNIPSENNKIEYLEFLLNAKQDVIDYLHATGYEINDYILRRAFVYRWRHQSLDWDYYREMLDKRENPPIRKKKTKEEVFAELLSNAFPDGYRSSEIIEGYALIDIFEITGIHVEGRYGRIRRIKENAELSLERESKNPYDKNAVKIINDWDHIGYVARNKTALVRRVIRFDHKVLLYDCYNDDGFKMAFFALYLKK